MGVRNLIVLLFTVLFFLPGAIARTKIQFLDDRDVSNSILRRRVRELQQEVMELDERVARLEGDGNNGTPAPGSTPPGPIKVTCFLETPFDGIFDATEINETKARVEAVKACMAKVKSRIHCTSDKVKCGQ